jgi:ubiquinone/menaquinone biosynthesis C-methylase UbiE
MSVETEQKRQIVHAMWASVADRWEEHAAYVERRAAGISSAMLDGVALAPTDRVLELACGPGGLGIAAAARAAEVVLSDVVPAMVEIAAKHLADAGVTNATARVIDLEEIDEPPASFDVVLCREGLMFAVDPAAALAQVRDVLRGDGRVAVAVWGPAADNPWLSIVMESVGAQVGHPVPPPGMPGPFALSDADALVALFDAAGFSDVTLDRIDVPLHASSFEDWWARTSGVAGPVAKIIAGLPAAAQAELEARLRAAVAPYEAADASIAFQGVSLVVTARRGTNP